MANIRTRRSAEETPAQPSVRLAEPSIEEGGDLWRIARDSKSLDLNSPYSYVLWCRDFADTSVVARDGTTPCGFITGYLRPAALDTIFVWQIAVDGPYRGQGLARRMLDELDERMAPRGRRFLEATVTPGNVASIRLFESFARDHGCDLQRRELFRAGLFPAPHEPETLLRIGPLMPSH